MPVRRSRTVPTPRPRRLDRRGRVLVAAVGVVALLGSAALIGRPSGDTSGAGSADRAAERSAGDPAGGGSGTAASTAGADQGKAFPSTTVAALDESAVGDADVSGGGSAAPVPQLGAPPEAKIVRTGSIDVEVAKGRFDAATAALTTIATSSQGFVSASEVTAVGDDPHGTLTLRVPVARFDAVVARVRKVGEVQSIDSSSQDVTGEYTDVASRLRSLQGEREQITLVLGRAENIPDILSVRDRLSVVQTEIEQLQGRQQVLDDQTSLSTLTVSVTEEGSPATVVTAPPVGRRGFAKLWHQAAERFTEGARSIALGLASMAPWLLLALVLLLPARAIWRRTAPQVDPAVGRPTGPPAAGAG